MERKRKFHNKHKYTQEEIDFVVKNKTSQLSWDKMVELFNKKFNTNVTVFGLMKKIKGVQYLKRFTKDEISFILHTYKNHTIEDTTKIFNSKYNQNRTQSSIDHIIRKNVSATKNISITEDEKQFLKDNIVKYNSFKSLCKEFNKKFHSNKNFTAIRSYSNKLGLKLCTNVGRYKYGDRQKLRNSIGAVVTSQGRYLIKIKDDVQGKKDTIKKNYVDYNNYLYQKLHKCKLSKDDLVINIDGNKENINENNLLVVNRKAIPIFTGMRFNKLQNFQTRKSAYLLCDMIAKKKGIK